jgi:periplasmic divalent cation tolerance protein
MDDSKTKYFVLFCTTGSLDEASKIAEHLVGNHLVACANIVPSVRSIYWWNNRVNHDQESLMILKTDERRLQDVEQVIRKLHSYQNPELIGVPIEYSIPEYLKWLADSVRQDHEP